MANPEQQSSLAKVSSMPVITIFYNEFISIVQHNPRHSILIISGDMNVQIGKDENNEFCLHTTCKAEMVNI